MTSGWKINGQRHQVEKKESQIEIELSVYQFIYAHQSQTNEHLRLNLN